MPIQSEFKCELESSERLDFSHDKEIVVEKRLDHNATRPIECLLNLCWRYPLQTTIGNSGMMVFKCHSVRNTLHNNTKVGEPRIWG
jgi:hypothetical protein